MASKILLKRNTTPGKTPAAADLSLGELAINTADQRLYFKHSNDSVNFFQSIYTSSVNDLADVDTVTSAALEGYALMWDSVAAKWIPRNVSPPLTVTALDVDSLPDQIIDEIVNIRFADDFLVTDQGNGTVTIKSPELFNKITLQGQTDLDADTTKTLNLLDGENIEISLDNVNKAIQIATSLNPQFTTVSVNANGYVVFGDGSQQFTKAPRIYTNADAAQGITLDDLVSGDYYYDDITESILIMIDTGLGYNQLLDLTVRA